MRLNGLHVGEIVRRAEHKGLVGILELANSTRYGFTSRGSPIYLFTPWNESYPHFYVGCSARDTSRNVLAVVNFVGWETNLPRGDLREVLGPCGSLAAEESALRLHACPNPWKTRGLPELVFCGTELPLTPGTTFHIDPPGCRDIDDAITLTPAEGGWSVRIHIADVASLIHANPWLARAAEIGQTLYDDGRIVASMLPAVAEEACSLLPGQPRRTLTLSFTLMNGTPRDLQWSQECVIVKESYTYETIVGSSWAHALEEIATALHGCPTPDPHEWVEQLMLFYNREAAARLRASGFGILRRHAAPDMEALTRLQSIRGVPPHLAFQAGEYCPATAETVTHWGLGAANYCHASSPIRRWADVVNQTALLVGLGAPIERFMTPCRDLNRAAKRARAFERELFFVRRLLTHGKEMADGIILSVEEEKVALWVESWQRLVRVRKPVGGWAVPVAAGEPVRVALFCDMGQRNWKRRLVAKLSPA